MKLKNGSYYNRTDFIKHICTIVLGRYAYNGTPVSFLEVGEYLGASPDSMRMKKKNIKIMKMLEAAGIKVKKIKGINHFYLATEEADKTLII